MKKKRNSNRKTVRVPLLWSICSAVALMPLCPFIFFFILRKSGASFPIAAGQSTDPFFFGGVFAIVIPLIIYVFFIDKVLRGIVMKRSSADIAKDVATDIAKTAAVMAAEVVLDAALGGSSAGSHSSSGSGGTKGGGGESGGGGASGGY